jgi:hypothetical protein
MLQIPIKIQISVDKLKTLYGFSKEWDLCAFPVSYDGKVAFIFRRLDQDDEFKSPAGEENDDSFQYEIILQDCFAGDLLLKVDQHYVGEALVMFGFYEGGYVAVTRDSDDEYFVRKYDMKSNRTEVFSIGLSADRCLITKDGRVAVGYWLDIGDRLPVVRVFGPGGKDVFSFSNGIARKCTDLNADEDGNIWFHCMPDSRMYRLSLNGELTEYSLPVAGMSGFAVSEKSGSPRFLLWTDAEKMGNQLYFCSADSCAQCCLDDIAPDQMESCSIYGSRIIILTKDNTLCFSDIADIPL